MAWDPVSHNAVLFGGHGVCPYNPGFLSACDDTWIWDGSTWQQPSPLPLTKPLPREGHAMAIDPVSNTIMLVGGNVLVTAPSTFQPMSDTWLWTGTAWTLAQASDANLRTPAGSFSIAPDLQNGQMLLFTSPEPGVTETWVWK